MTSVSSYSTRARSTAPRPPPHPLAAHPAWIHARFERAVEIIQSLPKSGPIQTSYDQKLELYSVYKQATEGDIKGSRPGLLDILGRAKWDAWNKRRGTTQLEAKRLYVDALVRVLRSFSDRTQAVELLHELEDFELDPPRRDDPASMPRPRPRSDSISSSTGSSSSTASYDARDRRSMPPPPPAPQSAARSSRPHRAPALSTSGLAPSLPGYGPPRTRADVVRASASRRDDPAPLPHHHHYPHHRRPSGERAADSAPSSSSDAGDGDDDIFHPAAASVPPSVRSHAHRAGVSAIASGAGPAPPRGSATLPPPRPLAAQAPRSVAGSSVAGGGAALPIPLPLTAGNLRAAAASSRAPSVVAQPLTPALPMSRPPTSAAIAAAAAALAPPPAQLDAALERIQLSLTALHERLSLLEQRGADSAAGRKSGGVSSRAVAADSSSLALVTETVRRLLEAVRLRRRRSDPSVLSSGPGSPSIALRTRTSADAQTTASNRFSLGTLLWRLMASLILSVRRLAGDACVVLALAVLIGRFRGVDVLGLVLRRVLAATSGTRRVQE